MQRGRSNSDAYLESQRHKAVHGPCARAQGDRRRPWHGALRRDPQHDLHRNRGIRSRKPQALWGRLPTPALPPWRLLLLPVLLLLLLTVPRCLARPTEQSQQLASPVGEARRHDCGVRQLLGLPGDSPQTACGAAAMTATGTACGAACRAARRTAFRDAVAVGARPGRNGRQAAAACRLAQPGHPVQQCTAPCQM